MKRLFDSGRPHFAAWVWLYDIDRDPDPLHALNLGLVGAAAVGTPCEVVGCR
jgi:hypothetical protein